MTHILTTFGDVALPEYEPQTPVGLGPVTLSAVPLALGGALNPLGSAGRAMRQGGILQYSGQYSKDTNTALQTAMDAIRARVGYQDVLWQQMLADGSRRWAYAVLLDVAGELTGGHVLYADLALMFQVLSPVWNGEDLQVLEVSDLFDDGDDLPTTGAEGTALGGTIALPTLTNNGNVPVTDIIITITAGASAITAAILTSSTTGHVLAWAGSLASGDDLVIDVGALSVLNDGDDAYSEITPPADKDRWMELMPGANVWTISLSGSDGTIRVEWYDAWA